MKRKLITSLLVVVFVLAGCLTVFAACDGNGDVDHTIYFYSSQGDSLATITDAAVKQFEETYPGWTIEHTQPGGYDQVLEKVRSDLTAGTQPDLAYCYADHVAQYLSSGTVVDMNKYLLSEDSFTYTYNGDDGEQTKTIDRIGFTQEDVDSFNKGYFEEGKLSSYAVPDDVTLPSDALVTLPFVKSTEVMFYNPDALKELGIGVPTTWGELWDACALAKAKWQSCTPLGYDSEANWFITMAQQRGFEYTSATGNHYLFNNDGAKEWLDDIADKYNKGYITTQQIYGGYTSGLFTKGPKENGSIFCIGSTGGASNQAGSNFTTEVAPIPGTPVDKDGKPVASKTAEGFDHINYSCISQGPSIVMLTGGNGASNPTEKEIMTFQFIKILLSKQFQIQFGQGSGYNPMRNDVYDDEGYQTYLNGKDEDGVTTLEAKKLIISKTSVVGKTLSEENRFFVSPAFVGSSVARAQMTSVVQYVLLGQKQPDRALADAYKACGGK